MAALASVVTHSRASSVVRIAGCLDSLPACSEGMVHLASGQGRKGIRWSRSSILWTNYGRSTRLIPSQENLSRTGSLAAPLVCQPPSPPRRANWNTKTWRLWSTIVPLGVSWTRICADNRWQRATNGVKKQPAITVQSMMIFYIFFLSLGASFAACWFTGRVCQLP